MQRGSLKPLLSAAAPAQTAQQPSWQRAQPARALPVKKILSGHFNFAPINQIITEAAACAPLDPGCCRLLGEAVINEKDQLP